MWELTQKEFDSVSALKDGKRVEYAIKRLADNRVVWLLQKNPQEWYLVQADDGPECVPIWPHERFAEACREGLWASAKPVAVSIDDFVDKWVTGMDADNRYITVFPVPGMRGVVLEPWKFEQMLRSEMAKY